MSMSATTSRVMGSPPEAYDGSPRKAEAFWSAIENYFYLNDTRFSDENTKIATALTYFKVGTPAREWARDKQKAALALNPRDFGRWRAFKKEFQDHFVPAQSQLEAVQAMHNVHMIEGQPFNHWYQEWSSYAARSGANENTKMYTFRRAIPYNLHRKS